MSFSEIGSGIGRIASASTGCDSTRIATVQTDDAGLLLTAVEESLWAARKATIASLKTSTDIVGDDRVDGAHSDDEDGDRDDRFVAESMHFVELYALIVRQRQKRRCYHRHARQHCRGLCQNPLVEFIQLFCFDDGRIFRLEFPTRPLPEPDGKFFMMLMKSPDVEHLSSKKEFANFFEREDWSWTDTVSVSCERRSIK
jgi:hypothetical protein